MTRPCPLSVTVGGYLLGVLDALETENFRRHAGHCSRCRQEISYLTPVARFLAAVKTVVPTADVRGQFGEVSVLLGYENPTW